MYNWIFAMTLFDFLPLHVHFVKWRFKCYWSTPNRVTYLLTDWLDNNGVILNNKWKLNKKNANYRQ